MESFNRPYFGIVILLSCLKLVISKVCPTTVEHGAVDANGVVCSTGYTKEDCTPSSPVNNSSGFEINATCELDVVSLSVAVALMVFLILVAIILFSIIIRRYRKNRGRSRGAMYSNSNDYVMNEFGTSDVPEQDGYRRQEKENGDRVIEITMEDAATSNDFKYHEHKDDISIGNIDYVNAGYDNEGVDIESGAYEGATGGYYVDTEVENRSNRMIDIHDHDDLEETEFGLSRKSGKGKKNKSAKKKSKFKKSSDKSKQKGSNKVKKQQDSEPQAAKEKEEEDVNAMYTQVNKKPIKTDDNALLESSKLSVSADGLYESMEELNDTTVTKERPETENKLSSVDKDVVENTESVYAQVDREHLAKKKRERQRQHNISQSHVADGSQKHINNLSPTSHTTGSDEGYGEEIEAV